MGVGDLGYNFGNREGLTDHPSGHNEGARRGGGGNKVRVDGAGHGSGIFEALLACHGICAAGIDDDSSKPFAMPGLKCLTADYDRGSLELVLCEDGSG